MNTEESSKITNFSEALKYLVDTGILISKLRKFEKVYWVTCLNKYFSLMTKTYTGEKTEKILNEDEYLSKFKTPFLLFFNENFQDSKIPLTIDDNFDDNWINFTEFEVGA